jgi:hypothetical protein
MKPRNKPYFWVTWLTPLLSGEDNCEWKIWMKGHYQDIPQRERDDAFDAAKWKEDHTAYLTSLRDEYAPKSKTMLVEGQTDWKLDGKTATVAGKMDIVTLRPNLVVDAKTGKPKDSHIAQVKIYLLALSLNAVRAATGKFSGVLRYKSGKTIDVPRIEPEFKERFFDLVRRLAGDEMAPTPSANECRFCDNAVCEARVSETVAAKTSEF